MELPKNGDLVIGGRDKKTTPESTNKGPLKKDDFNRKYIFQPLILSNFQGTFDSFPGCNPLEGNIYLVYKR